MDEKTLDSFKKQAYISVKKATMVELSILLEACRFEILERNMSRIVPLNFTTIDVVGSNNINSSLDFENTDNKFTNHFNCENQIKKYFFEYLDKITNEIVKNETE